MFATIPYNRERARQYAARWALSQNPLFYDFSTLGGNCTSFVSQCLFAGCCRMNLTPVFGWYYVSAAERTASWAGVEYFYNFLVGNDGEGPFGREVGAEGLRAGDVIQIGDRARGYFHSLLVLGRGLDGEYAVAAQSENVYGRSLAAYRYEFARYLHIEGARIPLPTGGDCFLPLLEGEALLINGEERG